MKTVLAIAVWGVIWAGPAWAAPKDIATITCGDVKAYNGNQTVALVYWIEGYWQGKQKATMLQPEKMDAVVAKMDASCQGHLDNKIMDIYLSLRGAN